MDWGGFYTRVEVAKRQWRRDMLKPTFEIRNRAVGTTIPYYHHIEQPPKLAVLAGGNEGA